MPNLTLSIDEDLLDRAKDVARREQVSLSKLVREALVDHLACKGDERLTLDDWFAIADRCTIAPGLLPPGGGRGWTRGDLYASHRT